MPNCRLRLSDTHRRTVTFYITLLIISYTVRYILSGDEMSSQFQIFDPKLENISEFLERFSVQQAECLEKAGEDGLKKARVLIKCLPTSTISELQRKLQPVKLSAATYDTVVENLTLQFQVKKSLVGASVRFINRKQMINESIETYARALNVLANDCSYSACCLNRLLRDTFVAGVRDTAILSTLLQECDKDNKITFQNVVEKAKVVEQLKLDALSIKGDNSVPLPTYKVKKASNSKPAHDYRCHRCGSLGKHFVNECWALKLKCNLCHTIGHIARACLQKKKIKSIQDQEEDFKYEENSSYEDRSVTPGEETRISVKSN